MPPNRRVILVAYDGAQGLDVFGPADAFAMAGYRVVLAAARARAIATTSGLAVRAVAIASLRLTARDTVIVVGGDEPGIRAAIVDRATARFLQRAARTAERVGSVCSGAFVLAAAGILDGKRAATHWSACARLSRFRPQITVDDEAIYVREGNVWTSAGVTTGIDMALAIVEVDRGRAAADAVAGRLVLYARRPGFQSQWSAALVAKDDAAAPLAAAIDWLRKHPGAPVDVEAFARRAAMSVRTLHRQCAEQLRLTPRRLIEKVRVEEARALLHGSRLPPKAIAARCGFANPAHMARAFERTLGIAPRTVRENLEPAR